MIPSCLLHSSIDYLRLAQKLVLPLEMTAYAFFVYTEDSLSIFFYITPHKKTDGVAQHLSFFQS